MKKIFVFIILVSFVVEFLFKKVFFFNSIRKAKTLLDENELQDYTFRPNIRHERIFSNFFFKGIYGKV